MKTVALIDWNWMGHHPTYFTHFAVAIAEAGAEVVPFCADPDDLLIRLGSASLPSSLRTHIAEPRQVAGPVPSRFRPGRWRMHYDAWRFFGTLGNQLRTWERKHGRKIDLVFFACIYDREFKRLSFAESFLGYPWSGLCLHARSFRLQDSTVPAWNGIPSPKEIFTGRLFRSVAILDEGVAASFRSSIPKKPVYVFPDFTDQSPPIEGSESGLALKIKTLALGRPIVTLLGYLQWRKGLDLFTHAASDRTMREVLFFLAGQIDWGGVSDADKISLQQAWEASPNIITHMQRITSEATINSILSCSDVIFAAYREFPNSSNLLAKAAVFERPILVSEGHLMAERVKRFELGEIVHEGNLIQVNAALKKMLAPGYRDSLRQRAKWAEYREAHSTARLTEVMRDLIKVST